MLRRLSDLPFLVILMGLAAVAMLLPAAHAAVARQFDVGRAFLYSALMLLVLTGMMAIATANRRPRPSPRRHLMVLVGSYAVLPLVLALPITQSMDGISTWDAWFEMLSAFTTTGATLFAPEALPETVHLWRSLVGWFGGFFILVMALAVLAPMNMGGVEVATGRTPGRGVAGAMPVTRIADQGQRITYYAVMLFPVYGGLTLALCIGLLVAGDDGLVALCHAMAVVSTSGISPVGGIGADAAGRTGEMLMAIVMIVTISRGIMLWLAGLERTWQPRDPEVMTAAVIVLIAAVVIFAPYLFQATSLAGAARRFWGAAFTALSFLTTTGFVSPDWIGREDGFGLQPPGLILLALALVGGGVATTAGGVKLLRVYALYRHGQRELQRLIEPASVGGRGQDARQLRGEGAYLAWVFFVLFAMSIGLVTALLTLTGVDLEAAIILALSALTTTGPLAVMGGDVPISWAGMDRVPQGILAAAMVLGRLETLAVLAFVMPDAWRR